MVKKDPIQSIPIELILSILIAISVGFAIESIVSIEDTLAWLFLSIFSILLALWFIHEMLEVSFPSKRNLSRLIVLILIIFFPFTAARLNPEVALQSTRFVWGPFAEMIYGILLGSSFIAWGRYEQQEIGKEKKYIWILGIILIILSIGLYIFLGGSNA